MVTSAKQPFVTHSLWRRAIINSRNDGSKAFITKKWELENYVHPSIINAEFKIEEDPLVDISSKDWQLSWDRLDIPDAISRKYKSKDWSIKECTIKQKICSSCSAKLTKELLIETASFDEINTWFDHIKSLIKES